MSYMLSTMFAAVFAAVVMVAEHYLPWRYIIGSDKLHPIANYSIGLMGILLPYTVLLSFWQVTIGAVAPLYSALALWVIAACAGATVGGLYLLDGWYDRGLRAREAGERESHLRGKIGGDE